jgi:putative ABC transport system permease protein
MSAFRLAWLQLRKEPRRLSAAIAGILFAVVLMLVQLGFEDALFRSSMNLLSHLDADLVMFSPAFRALNVAAFFSERRLYQAQAHPAVQSVASVYMGSLMWLNPDTKRQSRIFLIGYEPSSHVLNIDEIKSQMKLTQSTGVVLFDRESRPEFGDVPRWMREHGSVVTEVEGKRTEVGGLFNLGTSFLADGTIITSDVNFVRLVPYRQLGIPDLGLIKLRPGSDRARTLAELKKILPSDVEVTTREEIMEKERLFWAESTPIGFVFRLGLGMGLVVGTIIVYQILYTDVTNHLPEYATLKALGHADSYLYAIVIFESLILSVLGFLPGMALSQAVYTVARNATLLPLRMSLPRIGVVYALTVVMCCTSGGLAVRRLRQADPAEIF